MKLNRTDREPKKSDFIGFKEDPKVAAQFREMAEAEGGASAVLQRFVRRYLSRRKRAA